ncbi:hypothetical protein HH214_06275 [Mucilaginibacter robiniae]|uniref:Uncharacterized protein n=1 Tax=Mucilaginibacter robiniae TaxID=2728022 RepID=A0A7L5DWV2_9SPHI|nr:hypothetical protein HH214_06275 [Mucilaginibacter robiniae]
MKRGIVLLLLTWCVAVNAEVPNLKLLRQQLLEAVQKRSTNDSLYHSLTTTKNKSPLLTSYLGAVEALRAKHTWNPYLKLKYLNDAENTLEGAVNNDPHNIEIRFMRFSIEHNVPGFLGYTKHLEADRKEMIRQLDKKYYASADQNVVITIIKFLINSKRCTPDENETLHKQLAALK